MKISNQVCSLTQAIKLYKLGIKGEVNYFYVEFSADAEDSMDNFALCRPASSVELEAGISWMIIGDTSDTLRGYLEHHGSDATASGMIYPAYTSDELGVMLGIYRKKIEYGDGTCIFNDWGTTILRASEAVLRADVLLYIFENKMLVSDDILFQINAKLKNRS